MSVCVCVEWCARDRTNWIWIAFPMKNFLFVYSVVAPSVLVLFYIRQTMRTWLTGCRHLTLLSTRHLQTLSEKTFSHKNIFIWKITPFISFFYLKPWMFKKEKNENSTKHRGKLLRLFANLFKSFFLCVFFFCNEFSNSFSFIFLSFHLSEKL